MEETVVRLVFPRPRAFRTVVLLINAAFTTMEPTVLSRTDFEGGSYIETLMPADGGEMYYRTCCNGTCRYSADLFQAEIYLHQMTSA